jgi:hypothetical protein
MSKHAEYSRAADDCTKMAQTARSEGEKQAWLKIADSWRRLARTIEAQELLALGAADVTAESPTPAEPQPDLPAVGRFG